MLRRFKLLAYKRSSAQTLSPATVRILTMSDIYAMQRANGDVFALDHKGRFCVPLFHSSRDAMTARLRNGDMLLFKPVAVDARLLRELVPKGGQDNVDLLLVKDPLRSLKRGDRVEHAELVLLVGNHKRPAL